tara:strand:- start:2115 stop:2234 length:120 start_codon:yes stop_codon:yes gene_type:complete
MSGQTHGSKGDKPRPIDRKEWDENHDKIDWSKKKKEPKK